MQGPIAICNLHKLSSGIQRQRSYRWARHYPTRLELSAEAEELAYVCQPAIGSFRIVYHDTPPMRVDPFILQPGEAAYVLNREFALCLSLHQPGRRSTVHAQFRLLKPSEDKLHPLLAKIGTAYASSQLVLAARFAKVVQDLLEPGLSQACQTLPTNPFRSGVELSPAALEPLRLTAAMEALAVHNVALLS